jgi:ribosomal-protein-alanine N-acetyltransferase
MSSSSDVLTTARLILRPYGPDDVADILAYATLEPWSRYLPVPVPYERAHAEQFVVDMMALDGTAHLAWAIVLQDTVVGGINTRFFHDGVLGEMGWSLAPWLWGQGLATEAAQAVLDSAFTSRPEIVRVRAMADVRNVPSQRVMEKIGMRHEGTLRKNRTTRGELIDEMWFGVLREEWDAHRSALSDTQSP